MILVNYITIHIFCLCINFLHLYTYAKFVKLVKCITVPVCFKKRASEKGIYRNIKNSLFLKHDYLIY